MHIGEKHGACNPYCPNQLSNRCEGTVKASGGRQNGSIRTWYILASNGEKIHSSMAVFPGKTSPSGLRQSSTGWLKLSSFSCDNTAVSTSYRTGTAPQLCSSYNCRKKNKSQVTRVLSSLSGKLRFSCKHGGTHAN